MPQLPELPWIWVPGGDAAHTQLALFRRTLELDEAPASAKIRISAETRYKLYVNGVLAALGPAKGDASEWFVDTVELAGLLRRGENVLAVEVLHYGTAEAQTNQSLFHTSTPGLYVEDVATGDALLGDALDGREQDAPAEIPANALAAIYAPRPACGLDVRADRRWRCRVDGGFSIVSENPFFGPLQILEDRAGDVTLAGWKLPGFDDSAWQKADPYDIVRLKTGVSPRNLRPRPIPAMRRERCRFAGLYGNRETSVPAAAWEALLAGRDRVVVPAHATEFVEIAAGEEMTGFLSLRVAGGAGATVRILTSECYVEAQEGGLMAETRKGDRTDASGELAGFTDTYRVAGSGSAEAPEAFEPFWFRTFRFVRLAVETADEPLALAGFDYEETGYPLEVRTWVETSDPAMADIWDMSLRTLERCMQETYTDCPFYEQLQYLHDARSQILFTYAVAADDRLARQAIDQFSRALRPDGTLNASYPCTEPNIIPGFSIYYILMLHDHMMWFGDRAFCMRYLPYVDAILGYFDRNLRADGLVGSLGGVNMGGRYLVVYRLEPGVAGHERHAAGGYGGAPHLREPALRARPGARGRPGSLGGARRHRARVSRPRRSRAGSPPGAVPRRRGVLCGRARRGAVQPARADPRHPHGNGCARGGSASPGRCARRPRALCHLLDRVLSLPGPCARGHGALRADRWPLGPVAPHARPAPHNLCGKRDERAE